MDIEESKRRLIGDAIDNLRSAGCTTAEIAEVIFEKLVEDAEEADLLADEHAGRGELRRANSLRRIALRARTEARDLAMGIPELLDEGR